MSEVKKASFSFKGYQVRSFSYAEPVNPKIDSLSIDFDPSGTFSKGSGIFEVKFNFKAFIKEGDQSQDVITAILYTAFQFEGKLGLSDVPSYFYRNSIAIVFPYLRAFISNLTLQANVKPIILPILNLSDLEEPLRKNTVEID
jgi:preprotein translocase subunit SecB